jgi:hypothetical protein
LSFSPLWIVDGQTTIPQCQGSLKEEFSQDLKYSFEVFYQIDEAEKSLDAYNSLSTESKIKIQATIRALNEEIKNGDKLFIRKKLEELNEKNKWTCIASSLGYLEKSAQDDEGISAFLKTYEKLSSFFNQLQPLILQPDQRLLVNRFQHICNQFAERQKKKEERLWKDVAEDLKSLEKDFPSCEETERNSILLIYVHLNNFFSQLDGATLRPCQIEYLQKFEALSTSSPDLIAEYYQTVHLTEEALNEFASFEMYFNDIPLEPVSKKDLQVITSDYNIVVGKLRKQAFFICPDVWNNVNERLSLIQGRLKSFEISKSPTSVADL